MSKSADAFRTISEVADWLGVPAHVLRFWESKFTQVKPVKRAGGRRYYRPADMQLLGGIRKLLHDEGMTIKGVQKIIRDHGVRHVAAMSPPLDGELEEAISGIALDVRDAKESRGTVLSFDRSSAHEPAGAEQDDAAQDDVPETPDTAPDDAADSARGVATDAPPIQTDEAEVAETDAPESTAQTAADSAAVDPAEGESEADDADDATATQEQDATPQGDTGPDQAAPPRVADISVPDDLADDVAAPTSLLTTLAALDPAVLVTERPALTDLAARMAELRARMGKAPKA